MGEEPSTARARPERPRRGKGEGSSDRTGRACAVNWLPRDGVKDSWAADG